jgi:mutator protein MutT
MIKVVTALIKNSQGKILLQRRAPYRQFGGRLETPGGKVNAEEDLRVALSRELNEELGLIGVSVGSLVHTYVFNNYSPEFEVYFFEVDIGNQIPTVNEDATDLDWYSLNDLEMNVVPSLESYLTHV